MDHVPRHIRKAVWLLALASASCTFHRVRLDVEPVDVEGQFVRACEILAAAGDRHPPVMRGQQATLAALASIRPPGRFCFVCRRMRRCAARLDREGRNQYLTARQIALLAVGRTGSSRTVLVLPAPGGPELDDLLERSCESCAAMPARIQDGTWDKGLKP